MLSTNVINIIDYLSTSFVLVLKKYLEDKYSRLYWSSCATLLVGFIYNHIITLNIMRMLTID